MKVRMVMSLGVAGSHGDQKTKCLSGHLDFIDHLDHAIEALHGFLGDLLLVVAGHPASKPKDALLTFTRYVPSRRVCVGEQAIFGLLDDLPRPATALAVRPGI